MLAVHLENRRVKVRNVRRPQPPAGFALIRLLVGGICNTDLELQRGYYGFRGTPGHEFVGEVVRADHPHLLGRRVVGEINLACRKCEWCRRGLGRHCPTRTVLGIVGHPGAFREFLTLPEANLHVVPDSISSEDAVFVEPLAAACEILDQASIPDGAEIAVLGDGKLGLLIAQVLNARRTNVHLYGRHKSKLQIAERAGVQVTLAKKKLPFHAYDRVVEATGSQNGLYQAIQMTRPRGTVFLKSTIHGSIKMDTAPVIVNEITLVGSRCGRFQPALALLQSRSINVADMISDSMPLAWSGRAFTRAAEPGVLKVLLQALKGTEMEFELKTLSAEAVPAALERAERYRLLNEPLQAESICLDILGVEPSNQQALVCLLLALSEQFGENITEKLDRAWSILPKLSDEYLQVYYQGILLERQARLYMRSDAPGSNFSAYDLFREAMRLFEKAEQLRPSGNDEALLRWNTCARTITGANLQPRPLDDFRR